MKCLFCNFEGDINELREHYIVCEELKNIQVLKDTLIKEKLIRDKTNRK